MVKKLVFILAAIADTRASIWNDAFGGLLEGDSSSEPPRQTGGLDDKDSTLLRSNAVNAMKVFANMSIPGMPRGPTRRSRPGLLESRQDVRSSEFCFLFWLAISTESEYFGERLTRPKMLIMFLNFFNCRVEFVLSLGMFLHVQQQNACLVVIQHILSVSVREWRVLHCSSATCRLSRSIRHLLSYRYILSGSPDLLPRRRDWLW